MAQVKHGASPLLLALLILALPSFVAAQVPAEGLRAEGEGAWEEALRIYEDAAGRDPERAELWLRIADIQSHLGRAEAALTARERAAEAAPRNREALLGLSRAYSEAGQPRQALAWLDRAMSLDPHRPEDVLAHAQLATWAGEYRTAQRDYRELVRARPEDGETRLALARVSSWAGNLDGAVAEYREYANSAPQDTDALLEYARVLAWRGDPEGGLEVLDRIAAETLRTPGLLEARAGMLAWAGRPRSAQTVLAPLLTTAPDDYGRRLAQTVALALDAQPGNARASLETLRRLGPDRKETADIAALIETPLRASITPGLRVYEDSDALTAVQATLEVGWSPTPSTRLMAGGSDERFEARPGSGLERLDGGTKARQLLAWAGLEHRLSPSLAVGGRVGTASTENARDLFTFRLGADLRPKETLTLGVEQERGFLALSPRTLSLGIERSETRVRMRWSPALRWHVEATASLADLSDDNRRVEGIFAPRRAALRRQSVNLDLGVRLWWLSFEERRGNGYYDPDLFQSYAATAFVYWKISPESGLSVVMAVGAQKDESRDAFRLGGDIAAEATFGIHSDWMLKLNGAVMQNSRLASGAFRGTSAGFSLVRRF